MMRIGKVVVSLLLSALLGGTALAADPSAGPMVGHVTDTSARLWMEFPVAGEVSVVVYDIQRVTPVVAVKEGLEGPSPFVCDTPIPNLQPDRTYRIEVKFEGQPVKLGAPDLVIRTAPPAGDEATFAIALGGGIGVTPQAPAASAPARPSAARMPIFAAVNKLKPRSFLFLGDTGLLPAKLDDFPTTHRAAYRYIAEFHSLVRQQPDLQELLRSTACYAVYSDRDFGPVDADGRYVFAQESLVAFQRFWPNPDWGTPENPGCFTTFSMGDVDFFLLDARTFRGEAGATGHLFGDGQMTWLEKNLKASRATFKVIAAPCTLWGDDPQNPEKDSWSRYPAEQQQFLQWAGENRIDGIVGACALQPLGQITHFDASAARIKYPLFTLGTSWLYAPAGIPGEAAPNSRRTGEAVAGECFGTMDFGGQRDHRFVTLRLRDVAGKLRAEQTLMAVQLRN